MAMVVNHGGDCVRDLEQTHVGVAVMFRDPEGQLVQLLTMAYHDNLPD